MTRSLGIGLVSVGWMGRLHSTSYARLPHHFADLPVRPRLVVAADTDADRRAEAVGRLGYERAVEDWRAVIDDPAVEAISITAPNHLHHEVALAAIEAGKPFWIEKPVGRTPEETIAVAAAAEAAGVPATVGFNYRQAPAVQHAAGLVAAGDLGTLTHIRAWFLNDYASRADGAMSWRFTRELGGTGVLGDLMSHAVDLVQFVAGPIGAVSAQQATHIAERPLPGPGAGAGSHFASAAAGAPRAAVENEDYASALIELAGGARGTIEACRTTVGPHCALGFAVHGSDGALEWDFARMNELRRFARDPRTGDAGYQTVLAGPAHGDFAAFQPGPGIAMGYDDLKVLEARTFCLAAADGEPRAPGLAEARAMAHVLAAMERSFASGAWERAAGVPVPQLPGGST
jgi:predicted dehydrogenase